MSIMKAKIKIANILLDCFNFVVFKINKFILKKFFNIKKKEVALCYAVFQLKWMAVY